MQDIWNYCNYTLWPWYLCFDIRIFFICSLNSWKRIISNGWDRTNIMRNAQECQGCITRDLHMHYLNITEQQKNFAGTLKWGSPKNKPYSYYWTNWNDFILLFVALDNVCINYSLWSQSKRENWKKRWRLTTADVDIPACWCSWIMVQWILLIKKTKKQVSLNNCPSKQVKSDYLISNLYFKWGNFFSSLCI